MLRVRGAVERDDTCAERDLEGEGGEEDDDILGEAQDAVRHEHQRIQHKQLLGGKLLQRRHILDIVPV